MKPGGKKEPYYFGFAGGKLRINRSRDKSWAPPERWV